MHISRHITALLAIFTAIVIGSIALIVLYRPAVGLEFTGGSLTEVQYAAAPKIEEVRNALETLTLTAPLGTYSLRETQTAGGVHGLSLRARDLSDAERIAVHGVLTAGDASSTIARYTTVGPVIGHELAQKAWWAIGAIVLLIVGYIAYAFRSASGPVRGMLYGIVTIIVLIPDLLVPAATLSILGHTIGAEVDILFVIALLSILGYAVNDTIVIFDRVREEFARNETTGSSRTFEATVDDATRLSVGRSINTSLTVVLSLVALYVYGNVATTTFALVLIAGVVAGTYASLFIASPLLIVLAKKFPRRDGAHHTHV